jgi:hypothetical protein
MDSIIKLHEVDGLGTASSYDVAARVAHPMLFQVAAGEF